MQGVILEVTVCGGVGWILTTLTCRCLDRFQEVWSGWRLKLFALTLVCVFSCVWVCAIGIEVCSMSEVPHKGEALGLLLLFLFYMYYKLFVYFHCEKINLIKNKLFIDIHFKIIKGKKLIGREYARYIHN